jgi:hypothetical protein
MTPLNERDGGPVRTTPFVATARGSNRMHARKGAAPVAIRYDPQHEDARRPGKARHLGS